MDNLLTTLITAALGGGGVVALVGFAKNVFDHFTGKVDRERARNNETLSDYKETIRDLKRQVSAAEAEADQERDLRLKSQKDKEKAFETLSYLRRVALEHGVPPEKVYQIITPERNSND